ncbi:hypothetical protein SAMD00019534_108720 [Acytostelium subglobosum LB1]|uniref:hypothetical protein n=1 Tax=Acytostelium subglobosum LB1 TaxID=1410327 RepID=UPI000644BDE2|nr:hypothetical protein SAMD00019534_108720 [Acytostelium subglobosum LB1]GAM27696.1 hypothetical protein SAMD00019534_108720 [Acytostelium subglobosum LB1]|eukprot:XP_012749355.1 hypothetical protein SAMD00019534_108720 [Acytostelium subglobosum LB1]
MADASMVEEIFEQDVFVFLEKTVDKDEHDKLLDKISELGGTVVATRSINKKTTLVVCNDSSLTADITKAETLNIPIVKKEFIIESVKQAKRLNPSDYLLASTSTSTTSTDDKKRKDTDDGNADDNAAATKKAKLDILKNFEPGCVWCGTCVDHDETYPLFLRILKIDEKDETILGETEWPMLNAKAKFKATLKDNEFNWEEYEEIGDGDQLNIPSTYQAKFAMSSSNKPTLDGKTTHDDTNVSTIKMTMTKREKIVLLPFLVVGKEFEGNLVQDFALSLKVTGRKTEKSVEGTIDWVDFSTKTKFKGTVDKDTINFTEYEVVSGDGVELPCNYVGKLTGPSGSIDKQLSGDYKLDSGIGGKFTLNK